MTRTCPTCGQPLPVEARRDPPLPPLEHPAVVTIHDLPAEERAKAKVVRGPTSPHAIQFRLPPRDVVDGREGSDGR